ncbi:MAG: RagB/SusD family nutrient uptake outer membrane protein [Pseudobacter sp.]|uniref:RagB/SusD family nutrient uptake outer membrane protein n=1 Tax=Pseudobacter sp. TaxID=2045420 RepID=UPI003F7FB1DE
MKKYKSWPVLLLCFTLAACNKYLDVAPKGKTTLNTVGDFDLWLSNQKLCEISGIPQICWLTDHAQKIPWQDASIGENERAYLWMEQLTDATTSPRMLSGAYNHIYYFNTVLEHIDAASGGSEQQKKQLKAEALLGRANEYFYLVNLYGKPYDAATAAKDLAIPFVSSSDITTATPPRATVQEIYDHIISDLNAAVTDLPQDNASNRFRGSVHAAYSVLARTYFYMRNYSEAAKYAAMALQRPGGASVTDYNGLIKGTFPRDTRINEMIYARGSDPEAGSMLGFADSAFIKTYSPKDLRTGMFFYGGQYGFGDFDYENVIPSTYVRFAAFGNGYYDSEVGTTVAEMKLMIAENAARNNLPDDALQQLNEIRIKRFAPADYQPLSSSSQEQVLDWVLRERRHEMPLNGLRWFDMRRLDMEGRMAAVNRYDQFGKLLATLPPKSPRYTLQIPLYATIFNPYMPITP